MSALRESISLWVEAEIWTDLRRRSANGFLNTIRRPPCDMV